MDEYKEKVDNGQEEVKVQVGSLASRIYDKQEEKKVTLHATIKEAVFSAGIAPRLHSKDLRRLELELSRVPEFAVAAEKSVVSSDLASWQNNGKNGISRCKEDFMWAAVIDCYESVVWP
jgi:hypothetical protein